MNNARSVSPTVASAQTRKSRTSAVLKPIAAALLATGLIAPAHAVDTIWFGGSGDWSTAANWNLGIPGAVDVAVINAGSATLSLDFFIQGLTLSGGTLGGTGNLTVTGASTWTSGSISGAGSTNFDGGLALSGNGGKEISSNRAVNLTGVTTWSANTSSENNYIYLCSGGTLNNSGTFNDANASGMMSWCPC